MSYLEFLSFISKCLTINEEHKNKLEIEEILKNKTIDWDTVVRVSTGHFVFPALYSNLHRANFLSYLPEDLVSYMKHISDLNRKRNEEIFEQVKEVNQLLVDNNIIPIFLKGASFLVENLYSDITERMIGDIDFIVSKKNLKKQ